MLEVALNLLLCINSFSFYPFHILTWSSFAICNLQCLCAHCNGVICVTTNFGRTNPHLSLTIEVVATVFFMHMRRHCMQEHRVPGIHNETMYCGSASNHSRKEVNVSVTAAFRDKSRQARRNYVSYP